MKAITTRSGVAYKGPSIPTNPSPKKNLPKTTPIPEPDVPKSLPKLNIPYPSRRDNQKSHDKALNQMEKIFQIFQDLRFDISFADALLLMPRFAPTIKSLLMNKEKLLELAKIPLNENCSAMLLKNLPEKLGDPDKFLFPCNFPGMDMHFALRNAGATYQRLVDKAFHKQIGRNLEVYVDDLVIKSRTEDEIVRDMEETFQTIREINMKLNPKKCTFRIEE
ncbi:reverse transcriptase domain-containing protein [Tanacetum coccineum]